MNPEGNIALIRMLTGASWLALCPLSVQAQSNAAVSTPALGPSVPANEGTAASSEGGSAAVPEAGTAQPTQDQIGQTSGQPGSQQPASDDLDLRNLQSVFGVDKPGNAPTEGAQEARLPPPTVAYNEAVLRGLDKITARVKTFDAPIDQVVRFGTLEITTRACKERPPEETPESAAFLDIQEIKPDEAQTKAPVFSGWMFASSPSLSALEHPVYDVWVISCKAAAPAQQSSK
jgi:hypothetical protein